MQIAKEHIRQNILNAALPLFYAKGYSKVTIREIADDSHVGLSNIYNYYNSKEDIFRELVQPVINDFEIMLDKHHGKSGSDIMEMYTEHLFRSQGTSLENYKRDFADRSTEVVKEYFRNMKIKHPELNINISEFTIHLHTVWMFTMLEELIMHKKVSDEIEQIITEYMIFSTTGWRELMKG